MLMGYDSPLTVHLGFYYTPSLQDAVNMELSKKYGESFEANRWTDVIHRLYNIDIKYSYIIPEADYDQRLRLDMAANTLPDIFVVRNQADLVQMAQAGVLADLSDLREAYGSPTDEANWTADGGLLIDMSTIGGKLYGLPIPVPTTDFFSYLWLRKDWVDALRINPPKTLDDLTRVIEAFVNADFDRNGVRDTVGLTMEQDFYYSSRGIFNGCGAYPEVWENLNGVLSWGGVNPNNKKALAYLADLYRKGYIDHEFVRYTYNDKLRAVINGKAGVMYGGHWEVAAASELHNMDPKADWMAVPLPSLDGSPVRSPMKPAFRGWVVANAKYTNPEVAYKLKGTVGFYLSDGNSEPAWWSVEGTGCGRVADDGYRRRFSHDEPQQLYQDKTCPGHKRQERRAWRRACQL
jgi:putative aldouronate transport system substrate-binding protein